MDRNSLEIFLPAFVIVFFGIVAFWAQVRRRKSVRVVSNENGIVLWVRRIDNFFKLMLIGSVVVVFLYSYLPEQYNMLGPIDPLDHPVVNTIGVLVLKLSLIWIVMAQLNIDKSVFMINQGIYEWSHRKLILYSQKLLLSGMVLMFAGLCITISSIGTIVISLVSLILFERLMRLTDVNT